MRFGSLFAGIGGFDLGLERAGMTCQWQVEVDPYCNKVLEKHWPGVKRYGDIREIDWSEVKWVDLVCGGFPCPVVSEAAHGRNVGEWHWPEFARCLRVLRPQYALVENVRGLRLKGRIGEVLGDLAELGFDAQWRELPASSLGSPHARARLWLVANANSEGQSNRSFDAKMAFDAPLEASLPWPDPPSGLGMAHGVPKRVDRLRGLGNAVVPQAAEWIGRRIMGAA